MSTSRKEWPTVKCTRENPYRHFAYEKVRVKHVDATEVSSREYPDGTVVARYRCPNCGLTFTNEIAQ